MQALTRRLDTDNYVGICCRKEMGLLAQLQAIHQVVKRDPARLDSNTRSQFWDMVSQIKRMESPAAPLIAEASKIRNLLYKERLGGVISLNWLWLWLLGGISFKKGCYVGQEIVARTHNLGRIKRRMYRFTADASGITAGTDIAAAGKTVGQIVDAVSTDGITQLLAVLRIESVGSELSLPDGSTLNRQPLPYPVPEAD